MYSRRVVLGSVATAAVIQPGLPIRRRRGLAGLGGGALAPETVYGYLRNAGFDPEHARMLVAIAQRESGLDPSKRCKNCVPKQGGGYYQEDSIGLFQINMLGNLGTHRMALLGLDSPSDLLDPEVSAAAAYALWAGNDANLNTLWSINRDEPFPYRAQYLARLSALPPASALEAQVAGNLGGGGSGNGGGDGGDGGNSGVVVALMAGAGLALLMGMLDG